MGNLAHASLGGMGRSLILGYRAGFSHMFPIAVFLKHVTVIEATT